MSWHARAHTHTHTHTHTHPHTHTHTHGSRTWFLPAPEKWPGQKWDRGWAVGPPWVPALWVDRYLEPWFPPGSDLVARASLRNWEWSLESRPQVLSASWLCIHSLRILQESMEVGVGMNKYVNLWDIWLQSSNLEVNKNLESDLLLQSLIMKNKID